MDKIRSQIEWLRGQLPFAELMKFRSLCDGSLSGSWPIEIRLYPHVANVLCDLLESEFPETSTSEATELRAENERLKAENADLKADYLALEEQHAYELEEMCERELGS